MKKTITITAHDRPQYLEPMLKSLCKNDTTGWAMFISIEPSDLRPAMIDMVKDYYPDINFILPETKLGVTLNPYRLLEHVFESYGSDYNIYLEEDLVVSPDICNMADWYCSCERESMCLCLCNIGKMELDLHSPFSALEYAAPELTQSGGGNGFSALGIVLTKNAWLEDFKPYWLTSPRGWDWSMHDRITESQKKILIPYKTRSDHMGEWGTHVGGPEHNRKLILGFLNVSQETVDPYSYYIANK